MVLLQGRDCSILSSLIRGELFHSLFSYKEGSILGSLTRDGWFCYKGGSIISSPSRKVPFLVLLQGVYYSSLSSPTRDG